MTTMLDYMPGVLEVKAQRIEDRIQSFIDTYNLQWLYVDWSGGKDSSLVLVSALNCCPNKIVATFIHLTGQTVSDNVSTVLDIARKFDMKIFRYSGLKSRRGLDKLIAKDKPWEHTPALIYIVSTASGLDYWRATYKYGFEAPTERFGKWKRWACKKMKSDWLEKRPPNGFYDGREAIFLAVGIRRRESWYRRKMWSSHVKVFASSRRKTIDVALAPILDLTEGDVWSLLKYYGVYDIVRRQYDKWGRSPNCVLCPLMSVGQFRKALDYLPEGYIRRVYRVLKDIRGKYSDGSFSGQRIDLWLRLIEEKLSQNP